MNTRQIRVVFYFGSESGWPAPLGEGWESRNYEGAFLVHRGASYEVSRVSLDPEAGQISVHADPVTAATAQDPELMTLREVAERCRVSPRTIQRWVRAGMIPTVTVGAKRRMVRRDVIDRRLGVLK